jgi:cysteine desulfurase family protein (TIGR01976 family)
VRDAGYVARMVHALDVTALRRLFPGLLRRTGDRQAVFFDGPAGSQMPRPVADKIAHYLLYENANHGGTFATSQATDAIVAEARRAAADLVGGDDPEEIVFGANMTTLTFHLARQLARTWRAGDEVVVTASDHDANVMPWTIAARDAGCTVRTIGVRPDTTLDLDDAARQITAKTRLVAVGAASNLSGTIHPVAAVAAIARSRGALTFVDAVHLAPHARLDVRAFACDFLACSAYKFFGPHVGVLWGRRTLLEEIAVDKVRPAADHGAEKWQTGTANFEGIAGTLAAIDPATVGAKRCSPRSRRSRRTNARSRRSCSRASRSAPCASSVSPTRSACANVARRCRSCRRRARRRNSPKHSRRARCTAGPATVTRSR